MNTYIVVLLNKETEVRLSVYIPANGFHEAENMAIKLYPDYKITALYLTDQ